MANDLDEFNKNITLNKDFNSLIDGSEADAFIEEIQEELNASAILDDFILVLHENVNLNEEFEKTIVTEMMKVIEEVKYDDEITLEEKVSLIQYSQDKMLDELNKLQEVSLKEPVSPIVETIHTSEIIERVVETEFIEPDISKFDDRFNQLITTWDRRISALAGQMAMNVGGGAGGGSTNILENDDVQHKQLADVKQDEIIIFNETLGKYESKSIHDVAPALFIQNTAPVTAASTYLWIQTEIGDDNSCTFWIEDGT